MRSDIAIHGTRNGSAVLAAITGAFRNRVGEYVLFKWRARSVRAADCEGLRP